LEAVILFVFFFFFFFFFAPVETFSKRISFAQALPIKLT